VIEQQLTRLELRSIGIRETIHNVHNTACAKCIYKAEWTAEEGWKAETKNGTNVALKLKEKKDLDFKKQKWLLEAYRIG